MSPEEAVVPMGPGSEPWVLVRVALPLRKGASGAGTADRVPTVAFRAGLQYLLHGEHWADGLGWVLSPGHTLVSGPR